MQSSEGRRREWYQWFQWCQWYQWEYEDGCEEERLELEREEEEEEEEGRMGVCCSGNAGEGWW